MKNDLLLIGGLIALTGAAMIAIAAALLTIIS